MAGKVAFMESFFSGRSRVSIVKNVALVLEVIGVKWVMSHNKVRYVLKQGHMTFVIMIQLR